MSASFLIKLFILIIHSLKTQIYRSIVLLFDEYQDMCVKQIALIYQKNFIKLFN